MPWAARVPGRRSTRAGSLRKRPVSRSTSSGMVAEKSMVRRFLGRSSRTRWTCGMNPRSSMWSASSITSSSILSSATLRRSTWSSSRPGVATTMSGPRAQVGDLRAVLDAADQAGGLEVVVTPQDVEEHLGLEGDLAGRRQDEAAHALAVMEALGERQDEGRRLARAGHGQADDVAALEGERDHLGLDLGRVLEADGVQRIDQGAGQAEGLEAAIGGVYRILGDRPHGICRFCSSASSLSPRPCICAPPGRSR